MADSAAADILRAGRRARTFSFAGVLAPALLVGEAEVTDLPQEA